MYVYIHRALVIRAVFNHFGVIFSNIHVYTYVCIYRALAIRAVFNHFGVIIYIYVMHSCIYICFYIMYLSSISKIACVANSSVTPRHCI